MTSAILYSSLSGNTKLLAETIYDVIKEDCKYCGETKEIDADRVYIGFGQIKVQLMIKRWNF